MQLSENKEVNSDEKFALTFLFRCDIIILARKAMRVYGVFRRLFFLDRMPLLPPACPMTETAVWQQSA